MSSTEDGPASVYTTPTDEPALAFEDSDGYRLFVQAVLGTDQRWQYLRLQVDRHSGHTLDVNDRGEFFSLLEGLLATLAREAHTARFLDDGERDALLEVAGRYSQDKA